MSRPATAPASRSVHAVPLAHISIEVGHLYLDDVVRGSERLRRHFQQVAPWVETARRVWEAQVAPARLRASTCFLIDDQVVRSTPATCAAELLQAARAGGVEIDYLGRESACVVADGVPLAQLVEERIVEEPAPGTDGSRPPPTVAGWLSNGQRSPGAAHAAGPEPPGWAPPVQTADHRHSVFVDVELWDERHGSRTWSCAFRAAVWQLLRLGLLRFRGGAVATPRPWNEHLAAGWDQMPPVVQVNPAAAPFSAYHTVSVLPRRFLATEHAVRTILSQVAVEPAVSAQVAERSRREGLALRSDPVERIEYVFTG